METHLSSIYGRHIYSFGMFCMGQRILMDIRTKQKIMHSGILTRLSFSLFFWNRVKIGLLILHSSNTPNEVSSKSHFIWMLQQVTLKKFKLCRGWYFDHIKGFKKKFIFIKMLNEKWELAWSKNSMPIHDTKYLLPLWRKRTRKVLFTLFFVEI